MNVSKILHHRSHRAVRVVHKIKYYAGLRERKNWFECIGMCSNVCDGNNYNRGHVTFLDCEDIKLYELKKEMDKLFDSYFILQSSHGNYHVINPVVHSLEQTKSIMDVVDAEHAPHTNIGYKRGDWVLRLTDKPNKDAPFIVYEKGNHNRFREYSEPHLKVLAHDFNSYEAKRMLNFNDCIGQNLKLVNYATYK